MNNWFETLAGLKTRAWDTLARGAADAKHAAHLVNLATLSPEGWPEVRTVVLCTVSHKDHAITVHADLHSSKMRSLRTHPRAALHVWDADQALQLRLQANVSIASGDETRAIWDETPAHVQKLYGVVPRPGAQIETALAYKKCPDPAAFAVLTLRVVTMDVVHLGADHRRAQFTQASNWAGQWLSP